MGKESSSVEKSWTCVVETPYTVNIALVSNDPNKDRLGSQNQTENNLTSVGPNNGIISHLQIEGGPTGQNTHLLDGHNDDWDHNQAWDGQDCDLNEEPNSRNPAQDTQRQKSGDYGESADVEMVSVSINLGPTKVVSMHNGTKNKVREREGDDEKVEGDEENRRDRSAPTEKLRNGKKSKLGVIGKKMEMRGKKREIWADWNNFWRQVETSHTAKGGVKPIV
ncbi:hypothetical protein E2542_SST27080 [Spatholobus suberectus]|nr:hypothetical protein E2542_SST27080 [Spatholobus suberectus]